MQRQVAATPAEAEEIAAAVAAVDEAERREAREVEILHRLEEIAEHKRREAEIIEERRREQIRLQEIRNRFPYLKRRLDDVHAAQRAALQRRHDEIMGLAVKQLSDVQDDHSKRKAESISQLESDSRAASGDLASSHRQQLQEMEARHEEEEDDYFLGIRAHLRGKPNREAREQAAVAKVKKAQAEDREALIAKHEAELTTLTHNGDRLLRNTIASMDADQERELAEMKSNQESCARQHAAEHLILEKIVEDRQAILLDDERTLIDSGSTLSSYRRIAAESLSFGADQNVSGAEFAVSTDVETSHYPASSSEGIEMPDVLSRGHPLKSRRPLKDSHSTITWGASWVSSASPDSPASNLGEEDSTFQPQELGIACQ
ncbi:MAG: hypothetical protein M1837_004683 [Sclerophora amabilis]|nr:MAG: hypothetical protein M1837_004683 [Sclerophora amabilis]